MTRAWPRNGTTPCTTSPSGSSSTARSRAARIVNYKELRVIRFIVNRTTRSPTRSTAGRHNPNFFTSEGHGSAKIVSQVDASVPTDVSTLHDQGPSVISTAIGLDRITTQQTPRTPQRRSGPSLRWARSSRPGGLRVANLTLPDPLISVSHARSPSGGFAIPASGDYCAWVTPKRDSSSDGTQGHPPSPSTTTHLHDEPPLHHPTAEGLEPPPSAPETEMLVLHQAADTPTSRPPCEEQALVSGPSTRRPIQQRAAPQRKTIRPATPQSHQRNDPTIRAHQRPPSPAQVATKIQQRRPPP
ncbi:hypothetical protein BDK51DRAFT_47426 [Blyttiomyces helicus]|uniref:Uncharacterized protein n=1 Tax=Blyttiomyces helicus TaxID=388810 RepID=A0A4V1IQB3_9FUNG|nr:hypothetical protein BDK51DRAFT_47426 [Blyttiomyces helicus]|eukprot:RKO85957.1 hypothetical protein BDK51DRAFT_47426 [Blyttiomyces helicus]